MEDNIKYEHLKAIHNPKSANEIVPFLLNLTNAKSVLDVGCGNGSWLTVFEKENLQILGIDGNNVDKSELFIAEKNFKALDLTHEFDLNRKFDLVISLEVAEHLPLKSASGFISSITKHSDIVVFSAALPNQGGQNHLNEQEPEFWVKLFNEFNFDCYDIIRPLIWNNVDIEWWYKQNIFIAVKNNHEVLKNGMFSNSIKNSIPCIIHPILYNYRVDIIKNLRAQYGLHKSDIYDGIKPYHNKIHPIVKFVTRFFTKYIYK